MAAFASMIFPQLFLFLYILPLVQATIFVTTPLNPTTCQGGHSCLVQWIDNGAAPLLNTIGPCFVGLFNGQGRLIQQIEPVNVAEAHSFNFIPDPAAGPDSNLYYINFTTVNPIGNPPAHYTQYSPFFTLTDMTGSFASPVASDTSDLSVPSTVSSQPAQTATSTVVISPSASATPTNSSSSAASSSMAPSSMAPSSTAPSSSSFTTSRLSSAPTSVPPSPTSSVAPTNGTDTSAAFHSTPAMLFAVFSCLSATMLSL